MRGTLKNFTEHGEKLAQLDGENRSAGNGVALLERVTVKQLQDASKAAAAAARSRQMGVPIYRPTFHALHFPRTLSTTLLIVWGLGGLCRLVVLDLRFNRS